MLVRSRRALTLFAGRGAWCAVCCATLIAVSAAQNARADPMPAIEIPAVNRSGQRRAPARPSEGDVSARARILVAALSGSASEDGVGFFLPREPFLAIKDMHGAAGYFARLVRWYREDIEAYRARIPRNVPLELARFELSRACTWMAEGREANRLPYWSCYGSRLVIRAGQREIAFRVGVMIHWGDRWYVTHLGPVRRH